MRHVILLIAVSLIGLSALAYAQTRPARTTQGQTNAMAANLRKLGQAIHMYGSENKGYLPADLPTLVQAKLLEPKFFVPAGEEAPNFEQMNESQLQEWIGQHSPFLLIDLPADRITKIKRNSDTPIAIQRHVGEDGSICILYADGHVKLFGPLQRPSTTRPADR